MHSIFAFKANQIKKENKNKDKIHNALVHEYEKIKYKYKEVVHECNKFKKIKRKKQDKSYCEIKMLKREVNNKVLAVN